MNREAPVRTARRRSRTALFALAALFWLAQLQGVSHRVSPLSHDQRLSGSVGVSRPWHGTAFSADALAGSGLRRAYLNGDHLPS